MGIYERQSDCPAHIYWIRRGVAQLGESAIVSRVEEYKDNDEMYRILFEGPYFARSERSPLIEVPVSR